MLLNLLEKIHGSILANERNKFIEKILEAKKNAFGDMHSYSVDRHIHRLVADIKKSEYYNPFLVMLRLVRESVFLDDSVFGLNAAELKAFLAHIPVIRRKYSNDEQVLEATNRLAETLIERLIGRHSFRGENSSVTEKDYECFGVDLIELIHAVFDEVDYINLKVVVENRRASVTQEHIDNFGKELIGLVSNIYLMNFLTVRPDVSEGVSECFISSKNEYLEQVSGAFGRDFIELVDRLATARIRSGC